MPQLDEATFHQLSERHRRELHVHCYRMLGNFEEAEDLVQETYLRAWRRRESFQGGPLMRAWLYRIATNACLDAMRQSKRRVASMHSFAEVPWIQPYPDHLLDEIAPSEEQPDVKVVAKETIELSYLAVIQLLPPRQRAVLILRDVLGWSANDTAALLEATVASVNSALQRARATLRERLPGRRADWARSPEQSEEERELLRRYVDAHERADADALAELLLEDARLTMPPHPTWYDGREAILIATRQGFDPSFGHIRTVGTGANGQPAAAHYLRAPGQAEHRPLAIDVLRVDDGGVAEISSFVFPGLFAAFGLPPKL
jgi:RNA polymerase sigma-70 factor (ECF subfamily)